MVLVVRSDKEKLNAQINRPRLPKIFAINHFYRCEGSVEVVEQSRVDADAAGCFVPAAIRLKCRGVAEGAASADGAEMVVDEFGMPAVNRIAVARFCEVELFRRVIGMQYASLGAERTGAAGQLRRNFTVDTESNLPAMAAS